MMDLKMELILVGLMVTMTVGSMVVMLVCLMEWKRVVRLVVKLE